jgi:hypothetical protein
VALFIIVTSGWLAVAAAIVRIVRIYALGQSDRTWVSYDASVWSCLEISVELFCVSAPAINPLLHKITPNLMPSILTGPTREPSSTRWGNKTYICSSRRTSQHIEDSSEHDTIEDLSRSQLHGSAGRLLHGVSRCINTCWRRQESDSGSTEIVLGCSAQNVILTSTSVTVAVEDATGDNAEMVNIYHEGYC